MRKFLAAATAALGLMGMTTGQVQAQHMHGSSVHAGSVHANSFNASAFRGNSFRGNSFRGNSFRGNSFRGAGFRDNGFRGNDRGFRGRDGFAAGVIGFVGLVVPHALRGIVGPLHRSLLPAVFIAGGAFTVLADTAARTVLRPAELPVGVVTALIGVPIFAMLLRKTLR